MTVDDRKEYWKQYRIKNKDRINAACRARLLDPEKRAKILVSQKKSYEKHKEKHAERCNIWRANNPEKDKEYSKKWRELNPEKVKRSAKLAYGKRASKKIIKKKSFSNGTWKSSLKNEVIELLKRGKDPINLAIRYQVPLSEILELQTTLRISLKKDLKKEMRIYKKNIEISVGHLNEKV